MKYRLTNFLLILLSALVSCIVLFGIVLDLPIIKSALMVFFSITTLYLFLYAIAYLIETVEMKKKMRNKRIKIRVEFTPENDTTNSSFTKVFSAHDLMICVESSLLYAKRNRCQIKSMTQLTTE
jgi:hypothetical protein